jgi:hypothetical protein
MRLERKLKPEVDKIIDSIEWITSKVN